MVGKNVLIIGANRGIGLNLAKAYAAKSWNVMGSVRPQTREDSSVKELLATGAKIVDIDLLDATTIEKAAQALAGHTIDLLLNLGGLSPHPKPWNEQTVEVFDDKFRTMAVVGTVPGMQAFPCKSGENNNPKIVNITSEFGSVTENTFGTCMAYRVAKAAANQVTVTLAREWEKEHRNVTIICMEPGLLRRV